MKQGCRVRSREEPVYRRHPAPVWRIDNVESLACLRGGTQRDPPTEKKPPEHRDLTVTTKFYWSCLSGVTSAGAREECPRASPAGHPRPLPALQNMEGTDTPPVEPEAHTKDKDSWGGGQAR